MRYAVVLACVILGLGSIARAQTPVKPLRLAIAGMSHGHVGNVFNRLAAGDFELVGIYEPDPNVVARYEKQYGFKHELVFTDLAKMVATVKPEAVAAFGPTSEHLNVVRVCAPRHVHVMVEKPLCLDAREATTIDSLARKYSINVLTNYETTWYPSMAALYDLVNTQGAIGAIRKVVVCDGHSGPKEIGVQEEFLDWLTDPVRNGGGAIMDFGCYGANLTTWLMKNAEPFTVTAVTQQIKPDIYRRVDDEATIILTYPTAQAILQPSWNWPFGRKDVDVYGLTGTVRAPDGRNIRVRKEHEAEERAVALDPKSPPANDPFTYLESVVRGDVKVTDSDLSSLANNVIVMRILDAARLSAKTGRTVRLSRTSDTRRGSRTAAH